MTAVTMPQPRTAIPTEPPFGVNELRLSPRQWAVTLSIFLACLCFLPRVWKHAEPFPTISDYRIPYALSKDYWLWQRRLDALDTQAIPLVGDSVIWGEYVRLDGTLSHFLNRESQSARFINCGVNGLFPLALEGLVTDYASSLHDRKIILQCNLLWMTSPKADLSTDKEERFNHSRLVPQFQPRIPCYRADANERLSALLDRKINYFAWTAHLQTAYFEQKSIPQWTLIDDGREPPTYPNAWRNPLSPLRRGIPIEPANDPQRGPTSPRHRAWNASGAEPTTFEWVPLDHSLQWQALVRITQILRARHNDVLILIGPFNEHLIATEQQQTYLDMRNQMAARFRQDGLPVITPQTLPTELYADASHPLTDGYARLAEAIYGDPTFKAWLARP